METLELRPYQVDACEALTDCQSKHSSGILAMPPGSGKTLTLVMWLRETLEKGGKVLWWVHREELMNQAIATFKRAYPDLKVTRWCADEKDDSGQVVVAMIFSSRLLEGDYDVVAIDEGHHAACLSYKEGLGRVRCGFKTALTATPSRMDELDLDFDTIAYQTNIMDLVHDGWLAVPVYVGVKTWQRHRMAKSHGDFTQASLRALNNRVRNDIIARTWEEDRERWGKTLVFCANVEHAESLHKALGAMGCDSVECLHNKMPMKRRREIVNRFASGETKVLVNVSIYTEGVDVPDIQTIFLARPTASETLYVQCIGRGLRKAPGKDLFYVVDFVDQLGKYSLLSKEWALTHLGHEDDVSVKRKECEEEIIRWLATDRVDESTITRIEKEFVNFVGILRYRTSLAKGCVGVTHELHSALAKFGILIQREAPFRVIKHGFSRTGADDTGLTLQEWKSLAWAIAWQTKGRTHKGSATYLPLSEVKTAGRAHLEQEIAETQEGLDRLDHEMDGRTEELLDEINAMVKPMVNVPQLFWQVEYKHKIMNLHSTYRRSKFVPNVRKAVRKAATDACVDMSGAAVYALIYWQK